MKIQTAAALWMALAAAPSFAKCAPNEGKIGYSFCVRLLVMDVKAFPAWVTRYLYGKETYGHRRVLKAKVIETRVPRPDIQAKDAGLKLFPGDVLRVGIADADHRRFDIGRELTGLLEQECHDRGDADFTYSLNRSLGDQALDATGTARLKDEEISCSPDQEIAAGSPGDQKK